MATDLYSVRHTVLDLEQEEEAQELVEVAALGPEELHPLGEPQWAVHQWP